MSGGISFNEVTMNIYLLGTLCFIFGYATCRLLTALINLGYASLLIKQAGQDALNLLKIVAEDVAFIKQLKHKTMIESGLSEKQCESAKLLFDQSIDNWKRSTIMKFVAMYPKHFRSQLKFHDWDSAMVHLTKINTK